MNFRKIFCILLSALLLITAVSACGGNGGGEATEGTESKAPAASESKEEQPDTAAPSEEQKTEPAKEDTTQAQPDEEPSEPDAPKEPVTIKITYTVLVGTYPDEIVQTVEDAINEHLEEIGAGVRYDLELLDVSQYLTTIDMNQISGGHVDVYLALGTGVLADQVAAKKVAPLTAYKDTWIKNITNVMGGDDLLQATTFNGELYGVPCYKCSVLTYYWLVPTEIAENDLGLEVGDRVTVKDIDGYLKIMHDKYPEYITMAVRPGGDGTYNTLGLEWVLRGPRNYSISQVITGIGIIGDDLHIQNLYASDYFREVCDYAYKWNQAGYIDKDASVQSETATDLVGADRALSYIIGYGGCDPRTTDAETDTSHNRSMMYIPVDQNLNAPTGLDWVVSYSCENVEAATEALSYLYTDPFVMNTILYGIEGRDWVNTGLSDDPNDPIITSPEGQNRFTVPYAGFAASGIMGNEFIDWVYLNADGTYEDRRADHLQFMHEAPISPIFGFNLDKANIQGEIGAIANVEAEYGAGLVTGELDPDVYLPEFLNKLKDAGIDTVVEEAQKQLDEWLASR